MQRENRHLDAEANKKAGEDQELGLQRQVASAFRHVGHGKTVAGRSVIEKEQGDQHEN